jgi:hypothetical protein
MESKSTHLAHLKFAVAICVTGQANRCCSDHPAEFRMYARLRLSRRVVCAKTQYAQRRRLLISYLFTPRPSHKKSIRIDKLKLFLSCDLPKSTLQSQAYDDRSCRSKLHLVRRQTLDEKLSRLSPEPVLQAARSSGRRFSELVLVNMKY